MLYTKDIIDLMSAVCMCFGSPSCCVNGSVVNNPAI